MRKKKRKMIKRVVAGAMVVLMTINAAVAFDVYDIRDLLSAYADVNTDAGTDESATQGEASIINNDNIEDETTTISPEEDTPQEEENTTEASTETQRSEESTTEKNMENEETTVSGENSNADDPSDIVINSNSSSLVYAPEDSEIYNIPRIRSGEIAKEKVTINGKSYYAFAITRADDLLALQMMSATDSLEDCAFTFTDSGQGTQWDLSQIAGFTGISPNEEYPFKGLIGANISRGVNYTLSCPLFHYITTDATVQNISLLSKSGANSVAAISDYLLKGEKSNITIKNVTIRGTFLNNSTSKASGTLFANVVNEDMANPIILNTDEYTGLTFALNGSSKVLVQGSKYAGGLVGCISGNVKIELGANIKFDNVQINGNSSTCASGTVVGYMENGAELELANSNTYTILSGITGRYSGGIVGYVNNSKVTVADTANIKLVAGTTSTNATLAIGGGAAQYAGGIIGYAKDSYINIKNISTNALFVSASKSTYMGTSGGIAGKLENCDNAEINNINISTSVAGNVKIFGKVNGGVAGDLSGKNITIKNIILANDNYIGDMDSTGYYCAFVVARVTGTNINFENCNVQSKGVSYGNLRGHTRGGIIGEIYTIDDEYNSIRLKDITVTGLNGGTGGLGIGGYYQGLLIGLVNKNSQVCLDGAIDVSKNTDLGNATTYTKLTWGIFIGAQINSLIYADVNAVLKKADESSILGMKNDIGNTNGIYINKYIDSTNSEKLIDFETVSADIKTCVNGTIAKNGAGEYVLKDEYDFMRLGIALATEGHFGLNCFEALTSTESDEAFKELLEANYNVTAARIDLRNTGIYSLMKTGISENSATAENSFSGSLTGVSGKTTIILENVISTQYNLGLFSSVSDASFKNLNIISGEDEGDFGYKHVRNFGAIAAIGFNSLTLENIGIGTDVYMYTYDRAEDLYYGGAIGKLNLSTGKLKVTDYAVTGSATNVERRGYTGGFCGYLDGGKVVKTSADSNDIIFKNVNVGFKIKTGPNLYIDNLYTTATVGGLIAVLNSSSYKENNETYTKMAMQNIVIDGAEIDMSLSSANYSRAYRAGGLLGLEWNNVEVEISTDAVDDTNTTDNSLMVKSGKVFVIGYFGSVLTSLSGKLTLKDIVIGESGGAKKLEIKNLVNRTDCSLFLHDGVNAYVVVDDNYTVNVDGITCTSTQRLDDIVGYNLLQNNGNAGGILNIKDDAFSAGTSQGYVNKLYTSGSSGFVRYYYNLFENDSEYSEGMLNDTIDTPEKLMVYHMYQYSDDTIKRFVTPYISGGTAKSAYTWNGNINLKGYSYYPTLLPSGGTCTFSGNVTIEFPEDAVIALFRENNMLTGYSRHYKLYSGLFINNGAGASINVSGITFKGAVAAGTENAFLVANTLYGAWNISDITFDGAHSYNYNYGNGHNVGLMISKVADGSNVKITGVKTTGYTDEQRNAKVASALIGQAGSQTAQYIRIVFRNIDVDFMVDSNSTNNVNNTISPFKYATLICTYDHVADAGINKGYGVYYFTSSDYSNGDVTLGRELVNGVEFEDDFDISVNALKYANLEGDVLKIRANEASYLPYVCDTNTITIFVNPKSGNLTTGCGTYEDPYIITNAKQLYSLYMYLSGNTSYDAILSTWTVNKLGNQQTGSPICDGTDAHTSYVYGNANFPTRTELAGAYYLITSDIDMSDAGDINELNLGYEFTGLGNNTYPFTGVIVGRKSDGSEPVITLAGSSNNSRAKENYGFIQYMRGAVVKDIILQTDTYEDADGNKCYVTGTSGFVASTILGGDNIIDNVTVKGTLHRKSNGYASGYVGKIIKGGLIIRDITGANLSEFNVDTSEITNPVASYYNYIAGKVEDGYILYESIDNTPISNNKCIIEKSDLSLAGAYGLSPMFPPVNADYLNNATDKNLEISIDEATAGITVNLSTGKHLEILAMALNSDSLSICGNPNKSSNGYNAYSVNRKALYNNLGIADAFNEDLVLARTYDNGHYEYPYLLYYYFTPQGGSTLDNYADTITDANGTTYKISKINKTAQIDGITGAREYHTTYIVDAASTLDVSGYGYSFRGIGALYNETYSRFNGSFDGQNSTIIVKMSTAYDVYTVNELGLFNEIDTTAFVEPLTERDTTDDTAPYIKNINVTGSYENNSILCGSINDYYRSNARTAAVAASVTGSFNFENITLQGVDVAAAGDVGGIIGRVINHGTGKYYGIKLLNCKVKENTDTGAASVIASTGNNSITNISFDAGGLIGKIGAPIYLSASNRANAGYVYQGTIKLVDCNVDNLEISAVQGSVGGFIGYVGQISNTVVEISGTAIGSSVVANSTINITNNLKNYNGSAGGVIGEFTAARMDQASRVNDTLKISDVRVENTIFNATGMSNSYDANWMYGIYGIGGLLGSANARYGAIESNVTVDSCEVLNVQINDNSTATTGAIGGVAGNIGSQKFTSTIDKINITNTLTENLEINGGNAWALGGIAGHINGTNGNVSVLNITNDTVKNSKINGYNASAGGIAGIIGSNTIRLLLKTIIVDGVEINSDFSGVANDNVNTYAGVAGGAFGTCSAAGNADIRAYDVEIRNSRLSGDFVGGFIGGTRACTEKFTISKINVHDCVLAGIISGGMIGRQSNYATGNKNFFNEITITNNKILGYGNTTYQGFAGGLVGRCNYDGNSTPSYYSNLDIQNNVIAVTNLSKCKAGGIFGSITTGKAYVHGADIKNNRIGYLSEITSCDSDMYAMAATTDFASEITLRNSVANVFEAPDYNAVIANQTDYLKYSFGIGNIVGEVVNTASELWVIGADIEYASGFAGVRPVIDVGIFNPFTSEAQLTRPTTIEPYALTRFSYPTDVKKNVHIIYTKDGNGTEVFPNASFTGFGPGTLEAFCQPDMLFGSLDDIISDYRTNVLNKETNGTLTLNDVINSYKLNIAYKDSVNLNYSTINTLLGISYLPFEDAAMNFDGETTPVIIADGQYGSAYDVVNSVIDALTNVGGTLDKGTYHTIISMEAKKATITPGSGGDCVLSYQNSAPSITIKNNGATIEYNGFDTFGTDASGNEYATISVIKVTYGWQGDGSNYTYNKKVDSADDATAFSVNTMRTIYIPVFVKERLEVNVSFKLKEGSVYNRDEIEADGYTGSVVMAKDTTYTILSTFEYGASVVNPNYKDLYLKKTLKLTDVNGNMTFDVGTKITMVDVNTGHAYYYEITEENATASAAGIPYTSFKDENGNSYENKNMQWFNDNNCILTNEEGEAYALDEAIFIVELPKGDMVAENAVYKININTDGTENASQMQITNAEPVEVTAIPGLKINFDNKIESGDPPETDERTYVKGELTNTKKDSIVIDARTAIAAAVDPNTGIASYWYYVTGSANVIDSSNNGKYLEIAIYLQEQNASKRIALPVGTVVTIYDDEYPAGREVEISYGQSVIYYYKNSDRDYALDNIVEDTYKQHKIVLDFSNTDLRDYTNSNYEIYMELIRTANPDYPMSSDKQDDYSKPVATASTRELAIATEVIDLITLGINTYRQTTTEYDIPFISKIDFSDVIDFEEGIEENINNLTETYSQKNYYITYRIYEKVYDANNKLTYKPVDNTFIKLYHKSGDELTEYQNNGKTGSDFKYEETIKLSQDEIRNGTDGVSGLITRDMQLKVTTLVNGQEMDLSNYKIEMRLIPYDDGITNVSDETAVLKDFFIFTVAKLKTDM